jgi:hypothetical protein
MNSRQRCHVSKRSEKLFISLFHDLASLPRHAMSKGKGNDGLTRSKLPLSFPPSPEQPHYLALFLSIHSVQFDLVLGPFQKTPFPFIHHNVLSMGQ